MSVYVKEWLPLLAALISGLSLLALVFGYGDRKQAHKELSEVFMALRSRMQAVGQRQFTAGQIDAWCADMEAINAKEPPSLWLLVSICEFEEHVARGHPPLLKPSRQQRFLAHWLSLSPH